MRCPRVLLNALPRVLLVLNSHFDSAMSTLSSKISALAVIGKNNNPLYVRNVTTQPDLRFHFLAHTSCDVLEERVVPGSKSFDLYLGLLYIMEDLAVFGYMTNTRIKFVLMVASTDAAIKDQEIKGDISSNPCSICGFTTGSVLGPRSHSHDF
ncbi:hypothetical protein BASA81_010938 [Batrachochytrium salamandrivorans]|nr:hypothetical protein BASA81_010938 [Batrachochytrium salamandrivorans]